jgi:hypothetical protein
MLISVTSARMAARNATMSSRSGSSGPTSGNCNANNSSSPISPTRRSAVARRQLPARCPYRARTAETFTRHAPHGSTEPLGSPWPAQSDREDHRPAAAEQGRRHARSSPRSSGAHRGHRRARTTRFLAGGRNATRANGSRPVGLPFDRNSGGQGPGADQRPLYTVVAAGCGWSGIAPVRSTVSATPRMLRCVCWLARVSRSVAWAAVR